MFDMWGGKDRGREGEGEERVRERGGEGGKVEA